MKKSQNMPVWLGKIVSPEHFVQEFAEADESTTKPNTCLRRV
jgi:hypothetical protein